MTPDRIRVHASDVMWITPNQVGFYLAFFGLNRHFTDEAEKANLEGRELHPLRGLTREIKNNLMRNPRNSRLPIRGIDSVKRVHVAPNPYAKLDTILWKQDPIRPGGRIDGTNYLFGDYLITQFVVEQTSLRLSDHRPEQEQVRVTSYPDINRRYGSFTYEDTQTHPACFMDKRNAWQIISDIKKRRTTDPKAGVVWDTYHALSGTFNERKPEQAKTSVRPLSPRNIHDWRNSFSSMLDAGIVNWVHLQALRGPLQDPSLKEVNLQWGKDLATGNDKSEIVEMIRMAKSAGVRDYTIEITAAGLIQNGLVSPRSLFPGNRDIIYKTYRDIADFVRNV